MFQQPLLRTTTVPEEAVFVRVSFFNELELFWITEEADSKTALLSQELEAQVIVVVLKAIINTKCLAQNHSLTL